MAKLLSFSDKKKISVSKNKVLEFNYAISEVTKGKKTKEIRLGQQLIFLLGNGLRVEPK